MSADSSFDKGMDRAEKTSTRPERTTKSPGEGLFVAGAREDSELVAEAELHHARRRERVLVAAERPAVRDVERGRRHVEPRRVRRVEDLPPELELVAFPRHPKLLAEAEV